MLFGNELKQRESAVPSAQKPERLMPGAMNLGTPAAGGSNTSLPDATFAIHALAVLRAHIASENNPVTMTIPALMKLDETLQYSVKDLRSMFVLTFGRQTTELLAKFLERQCGQTPDEIETRVQSLADIIIKRAFYDNK